MSLIPSLALASVALATFLGTTRSASGQVDLGSAKDFAVLGASTVTSVGKSTVTGDLGLTPGSSVTGFPPGIVHGSIHVADSVALQAQNDAITAFNFLAGSVMTTDLTGQDMGGLTLVPGVYRFTTSAQLTGPLVLDALGNSAAVFIFQVGSTLTTASGSTVTLVNGASACNIFWQIGTSATLGSTTAFAGNILAYASVTLTSKTSVLGRVMALNGGVTMVSNTVTIPSECNCSVSQGTTTTRDSIATGGAQANDHSRAPSISSNGRFVAFKSDATNLVTGDINAATDVFVRDHKKGQTTLVSKSFDGSLVQGDSRDPAISDNGNLVAYWSNADTLVPGDTNLNDDVFVRDLKKGVNTLVSVASNGALGDGPSSFPAISGNGRYVVFVSSSTNLVPADTNALSDVFVHDRKKGTTTRVSVATGGTQSNGASAFAVSGISKNGRFVAFESDATNLAPNSPNGGVFVHDRKTGVTELVSDGGSGISISASGRFVAFESDATNLVTSDTNASRDVFVRDRKKATTVRASVDGLGVQGNANSFSSRISRDGHRIAFFSDATNLLPCDGNGTTDAFLRTFKKSKTTRISVATDGSESVLPVDIAHPPTLDNTGKRVAFGSASDNLVSADTNSMSDVFVSKD